MISLGEEDLTGGGHTEAGRAGRCFQRINKVTASVKRTPGWAGKGQFPRPPGND